MMQYIRTSLKSDVDKKNEDNRVRRVQTVQPLLTMVERAYDKSVVLNTLHFSTSNAFIFSFRLCMSYP